MTQVTRARKEKRRLPNFAVGLIAIMLVLVGLFLAFTKRIPFTDRGYEIEAVFRNAQNVAEKSPVRIAGVNVGEVIKVEPMPESNAAVLKMVISEQGRPIHTDARVQLRPRLFLEGNYFLDMHPGSPSAPELEEGEAIPIQQTANSVQLDQILTNTLQVDVRGNLQLLLKELGDGLQKYGGAEGLRELYLTGEPAYKNTALVNEAFLGTQPGDLSGLVRNFDRVAIALNRNQEQLKDVVTNLRIVTGSFAAEDEALASSVRQLPGVLRAARPVFDNLNAAFPPLRAFAREALPGVRSTPATIDAALPYIRQLRALVSREELRGLTADLRPTIPQLAKLTTRQIPFLEQARALASCFSNVVIPWSNDEVGNGDTDAAGDPIYPVFKETGYGLVGIAGESRSGDANGQYIRVAVGGGTNTIVTPAPARSGLEGPLVGVSQNPLAGAEPSIEDSKKTPYRPATPCENQEAPDLAATVTDPPNQFPTPGGGLPILETPAIETPLGPALREYKDIYDDFLAARRDLVARKEGAGVAMLKQMARLKRFNEETYPQAAAALRRSVLGGDG
jgi:phospholipid/cholesterol/gamma-HCH transport system substrate-binding protein